MRRPERMWMVVAWACLLGVMGSRAQVCLGQPARAGGGIRAPIEPVKERAAKADKVFVGTLVNKKVDASGWARAQLRVDEPIKGVEKGDLVKVQWLPKVAGYDAPEGRTGLALLSPKDGDSYWLRADTFDDVKLADEARKAVGAAPAPAGDDWQVLFAEEAWYKSQAGEERVFRGTLTAVPKSGEASALMRPSFYSLGGLRIYTGARQIPALDALVGKAVEIRGKAVGMALEGQAINEIWPAAVRRAPTGAATKPTTRETPPSRQTGAPDAAAAVRLAREFLVAAKEKATRLQAFSVPPPADGWWLVEYHREGGLAVSPGPAVYVNKKTGEVTRNAPKGMPPRM